MKAEYKLYAHQEIMLASLREHNHFAFFMEQGTGKTLPMLVRILELVSNGNIRNALIICPRAVKGSWERDIGKFFTEFESKILTRVVKVESYDTIWRRPEYNKMWDMMVLDESHYIKDPTSRRYKGSPPSGRIQHPGIQQISRQSTYRYILTGTPIGNSRWEHLFSQYDFLDKEIFSNYSRFKKDYCILDQYYKPASYKNVNVLKDTFNSWSYRVTKNECLDLPEKLPPERWEVDFPEDERIIYNEMRRNYVQSLNIEAKNPLARLVKLRQICSGHINDENGETKILKSRKITNLEDILTDYPKKLVIFAEFKESIAQIRKLLAKMKINHAVLNGEQPDKTIWKQFQDDERIRVIVCQYRTASAGIDLFAADMIMFYEPTLSSQIFEQACDRIHRIGQKQSCSYILMQIAGSIEVKLWDTLLKHRDFTETELFGWINELREEEAKKPRQKRGQKMFVNDSKDGGE